MLRRILASASLTCAVLCAVPLLESCSTNQPAKEQVSDATITSKIKAKYVADTDISNFDISVETQEGVVYLTGRVKSQAVKDEAERIALNTDGVRQVVNHIEVGDRTP